MKFEGPLPRGIQFTWSRDETIGALGKPIKIDVDSLADKIPLGHMKCVSLTV